MATPPEQRTAEEDPAKPEVIWTPDRQARARRTMGDFLGTRHMNRLCLPGEGVDCVNLVLVILTGAGIIPKPTLPFYDERLGSLRQRNVIEDIVATHLHVKRVPPTVSDGVGDEFAPHFGDIVICRCGRQTNHVGIIMDQPGAPLSMCHVPALGFVSLEDWQAWKPRTQALLRITATGFKADPSKLTWQAVRGMADCPP